MLAADVLGRAAGWGALGPGPRTRPQVALTFDDGPSPRTLDLLMVLERHGAPSTFFVTAPNAAAHPDLMNALAAAGHQLEAHGIWHRPALLMPPWKEWAQVRWHPRAEQPGLLFRPPYGGHSPFTRLLARLAHRQIALWDVEGRDWLALPAAELAQHTLGQVCPGSVILLHDGPEVTPELLDLILHGLEERGLAPVLVSDLPMQRIGLRAGLGRLRASYGR
ncbi:polysaccharide deacetylase family protein [Deinococcus sp. Arct2-2]|uniref:polysaccharide deacetylase family protein n=1 Tax=Deinococcus sp. Arct2-2 TaxID=2568653 RepID=UPI001F115674|nr:polysaccharide deacetylase family protein [Deinococcus sp. Arct2-2]